MVVVGDGVYMLVGGEGKGRVGRRGGGEGGKKDGEGGSGVGSGLGGLAVVDVGNPHDGLADPVVLHLFQEDHTDNVSVTGGRAHAKGVEATAGILCSHAQRVVHGRTRDSRPIQRQRRDHKLLGKLNLVAQHNTPKAPPAARPHSTRRRRRPVGRHRHLVHKFRPKEPLKVEHNILQGSPRRPVGGRGEQVMSLRRRSMGVMVAVAAVSIIIVVVIIIIRGRRRGGR